MSDSINTASDLDSALNVAPGTVATVETAISTSAVEAIDTKSMNSGLKLFLSLIMDLLTPELCKSFLSVALVSLESIIKQSENKIDDVVVGALINKIRTLCGIPTTDIDFSGTVEKKFVTEQVNNVTGSIENTIDTNTFDIGHNTKLFENVSNSVISQRNNPFES